MLVLHRDGLNSPTRTCLSYPSNTSTPVRENKGRSAIESVCFISPTPMTTVNQSLRCASFHRLHRKQLQCLSWWPCSPPSVLVTRSVAGLYSHQDYTDSAGSLLLPARPRQFSPSTPSLVSPPARGSFHFDHLRVTRRCHRHRLWIISTIAHTFVALNVVGCLGKDDGS